MDEKKEVWNIFHDGSIVEVKGTLPNLSLRIKIPFLRNMFPDKGDSFWAHIDGCTLFEYSSGDNETKESDVEKIVKHEPEILDVSEISNMAHITCVDGELDLLYENISFEIDSGVPVSIEELDNACRKYWDDWGKRGEIT